MTSSNPHQPDLFGCFRLELAELQSLVWSTATEPRLIVLMLHLQVRSIRKGDHILWLNTRPPGAASILPEHIAP